MGPNDIAIKVENISKLYRIGLKEKIHENFLGALFDFIRSPLKNYRKYRSLYKFDDINPDQHHNPGNNHSDIIWALREVSFEVKQGEVLGIIGRNGSGKSTLLKILCRITDPTTGCAEIRGRVSSLLEVGTGFHPELTGRENIYLNGTILGMTKKEVDRKFDEIVDFSGVERFIDTPVKRYSSGMKVRLAFSVAAHLEPEILIIDEVLAVGDAAFQKKCLNKMQDAGQQGRTVLFVSHNMGAVTQLCERALWLDEGQGKLTGLSSEVVSSYLCAGVEGQATWYSTVDSEPDEEVQLKSVRLLSEDNQPTSVVTFDSPFRVEIIYDVVERVRDPSVTYQVSNSQGTLIFESMDTDLPELKGCTREPGQYLAACTVPGHLLKPDRYNVSVVSFVENVKIIESQEAVLTFDVSEVGYRLNPGRRGVVFPAFEWRVTQI